MNRIARYGLSYLGVGTVVSAMSYGIGYGLVYNGAVVSSANEQARACATALHLGQTALQTSTLPGVCEPYEPQFSSITVSQKDPASNNDPTVTTVYTVPTKPVFLRRNVISKEQAATNMDILLKVSLMYGGIVGVPIGGLVGRVSESWFRKPQDAVLDNTASRDRLR